MSSTFFINPRSNPELKSLYEIALIPPMSQLQDYFLKVMTILSQYFPIGYSALVLHDSKKDTCCVEALFGVGREAHSLSCGSRTGTVGRVLDSRQPMMIQNLSQEPLYGEIGKGTKGAEKINLPLLCIPLTVDGKSIGVININSLYGPREELTEDFQFLSILSAILSPVIRDYQTKKEDSLANPDKPKLKFSVLEEIVEEKLAEVLDKIAPYAEPKTRIGILDDIIAVVEKILIKSALEKVDHVQVAAAQLLGINRNTLRKKMKDLKIKPR
jgi:transcriptional regulator with GAF, ATPase, and Fis domain